MFRIPAIAIARIIVNPNAQPSDGQNPQMHEHLITFYNEHIPVITADLRARIAIALAEVRAPAVIAVSITSVAVVSLTVMWVVSGSLLAAAGTVFSYGALGLLIEAWPLWSEFSVVL